MTKSIDGVDIVVVGGGPAGLMAAIAATRVGARVVLCEQLDRPGRKLLATGGGRCNLTNRLPPPTFTARFGEARRFVQSALGALSQAALEDFFRERGVATECSDGTHVFPASQRAADVLRVLLDECTALGVTLYPDRCVTGLICDSGIIAGVETSRGPIAATRIIVAAGGRSYRSLGATGAGYGLATSVGHRIVAPVPALVGLRTAEKWPGHCTGIVLPAVKLWIGQPGRKPGYSVTGDLLFTHHGVSGPVALDISGMVARQLHEGAAQVMLCMAPLPDIDAAGWRQRFEEWRHADGKRQVQSALAEFFPRAIAAALCSAAAVDPAVRCGEIVRNDRDRLTALLAAVPLTITATNGFDAAMATAGGVALDEVDHRTLQSRLVQNLFFAGEVLDVDGPCGGYNLQWAFSSGRLAGESAGRISRSSE
jgi:predicted Rossmann fold flavoprotein